MSLLEDLNWRYATKRMNGKLIPKESLDTILEAIRLAPTSMGLQAYKVLVISDKSLIEKIEEAAAPRQLMLRGCSHLLVFAAYTKVDDRVVDNYIKYMAEVRNQNTEVLASFRDRFSGIIAMPDREKVEWTSHQVYIAMAYASIAAANLKIDSTPIEGFDSDELDNMLGLSEKDLTSVLLFPLGYRDETSDYLLNQKKVRKNNKDLFDIID